MVADTRDADFDPEGPIFDTFAEAKSTLSGTSTIATATWIVEAADGGNALAQPTLAEWRDRGDAVRADSRFAEQSVHSS